MKQVTLSVSVLVEAARSLRATVEEVARMALREGVTGFRAALEVDRARRESRRSTGRPRRPLGRVLPFA